MNIETRLRGLEVRAVALAKAEERRSGVARALEGSGISPATAQEWVRRFVEASLDPAILQTPLKTWPDAALRIVASRLKEQDA